MPQHITPGLDPRAADPRPNLLELPKVDLRVKVGGKVLPVVSGIDIDNIDRLNRVQVMLDRQGRVGIDNARIKTRAQDRRDPRLSALIPARPLIVGVPRRIFTDLVRILMNSGINSINKPV